MSAFGIPVPHADDPDRAVRAGLEMIRDLTEWNRYRTAQGKIAVDIGIGINTDNVVSGNIGSRKRMDYTVIGDGVNLAARLESACKMYGAHILVSESTFRQLRGTYFCREVDLVVVKGKTKPVAIFEVLDYHTEETYPSLADAMHFFRVGLAKYRSKKWEEATKEFQQVLSLNSRDKAAQLYIRRCEHFQNQTPPDDWVGVWEMEDK
jgi:adenylate cyclase